MMSVNQPGRNAMTAPWEDPVMLDAAIDTVCRVRDDDCDVLRRTLAQVPRDDLVDLALVLAAMVDADAPLNAVQRWTHSGFVGGRRRESATCERGHLMVGDNLLGNGRAPDGRQRYRCRKCTYRTRHSVAV